MRKEKISCYTISGNRLIYLLDDRLFVDKSSVELDFRPQWLLLTKQYLLAVEGNNDAYFKPISSLLDTECSWQKLEYPCAIFNPYFENDLVILFSGSITDRTYYVYRVNDRIVAEFDVGIRFVPNTSVLYVKQNGISFFDGETGNRVFDLDPMTSVRGHRVLQVLTILDDVLWMCLSEFRIMGFNLVTGEVKSFRPYNLLIENRANKSAIGFGGEKNADRFHFDSKSNKIITFANRYYMEISISDGFTRVVDLDTVSNIKLRIVKSNYSLEYDRLFFIARTEHEMFDKYYGVFHIPSGEIENLTRIKDGDGFFGTPPLYGAGIYAVLSSENVLYQKAII